MPVYEYKCKKCGNKFELRLGFSHDKSSIKCPRCEGKDPERVFSPFMTGSSSSGSSTTGNSCSPGGFS
jgi:putative FmdB family regulatory protein